MVSAAPQSKTQLLSALITVYRAQLTMSYTSGIAAPRKYGPDIMDLAGKLALAIPKGSRLCELCEKLQDATWKEYAVNKKDIDYYREKAYWETLQGKEEMLRRLVGVWKRWERELLGGDASEEEGGRDEMSDGGVSDDEWSDGGSEDVEGTEEEEIGQVVYLDDDVHTSPDFVLVPDLNSTPTPTNDVDPKQQEKEVGFQYAASAMGAVALTVTVVVKCLL